MMKVRLELKLSQKLVMTPQLQQAIKLLQLTRLELTQVVSEELLENPMLEEGSPDSEESETDVEENEGPAVEQDAREGEGETDSVDLSSQWEEYFSDVYREDKDYEYGSGIDDEGPTYERTLTKPQTLVDHLSWQLRLSVQEPIVYEVGRALIGNIDEDGYLRVTVEEVAESLKVNTEKVEEVLRLVQDFDPTGVGARDLRECLLIQVRQLDLKGSIVEKLIINHLKDIETRKYQSISKALEVSFEEVLTIVKVIQGLEPKPGRPFSTEETHTISPDIFLVKTEEGYQIRLNDDGIPNLRISKFYKRLLADKDHTPEKTRTYLENRFRSAIWLVKSIEQRNRTIRKVANSILKFQMEFFEKGIDYLKPLVLRQVADEISMHESTISRVTTNKYMDTPRGIFELKFFFNSSIARPENAGGELSSVTVREKIRKMISIEDPARPLKDQEIVARLKSEEIEIARRTVAKYRTELRISPANRRRFAIPEKNML